MLNIDDDDFTGSMKRNQFDEREDKAVSLKTIAFSDCFCLYVMRKCSSFCSFCDCRM